MGGNIAKQNREVALRKLSEKFLHRTVKVTRTDGSEFQGVVSGVNHDGRNITYQLAGRVGVYTRPALV